MRKHAALRSLLTVILTALALHGAPHPAAASARVTSTYRVCATGCAFTTIQAAITAASDGDLIEISVGVYSETLTIAKSLEIRGGFVASPAWAPGPAGSRSTVRGDGTRSVIRITSPDAETRSVLLSRLLIENGYAQTGGGIDARAVNLDVTDSVFTRNTVTPTAAVKDVFGAGIFAERGTLRVSASRFESNTNCPLFGCRLTAGGGIHVSATISAAVVSSVFVSNTAWTGAGIGAQNAPLDVISSTFRTPVYPARYGFGVYATGGGSVRMSGNRFEQFQTGANGGAVQLTNMQTITFSANLVSHISGDGAAVQLDAQRAHVLNNIFSNNENTFKSDGILTLSANTLLLAHNTLAANRVVSAGVPIVSLYGFDSIMIANNLLADAPLGIYMDNAVPLTLTHNLMYSVAVPFAGPAPTLSETLLTTNPRFVAPPVDLRIGADSPARDAGLALPGVTTDIAGLTRDASPDIGAHEFDALSTPAPVAYKTFLPSLSRR